MISLILIALAAACNALIDTLAHHFDQSIFSKLNYLFWNPHHSWRNKYIDGQVKNGHRMIWIFKYPAALTDAWHLFKSIMLALLIAAVVCYDPLVSPLMIKAVRVNVDWTPFLIRFADFVGFGIVWILVFNECYNKLFT